MQRLVRRLGTRTLLLLLALTLLPESARAQRTSIGGEEPAPTPNAAPVDAGGTPPAATTPPTPEPPPRAGIAPLTVPEPLPRVRLPVGVNWFGLETERGVIGGLENGLSVARQISLMQRLGVAAIRLPVSAFTLADHETPEAAQALGWPRSSLDGLRMVLKEAGRARLPVLLVLYNYDPRLTGANQVGTPISPPNGCTWCPDGRYDREDWVADLQRLARLSQEFPGVYGIELWNEPHKLSWAAWKTLAEEGGAAVLAIQPGLKIYVPGMFGHGGPWWSHWGEWHREALVAPISPAAIPQDRLVLSVHTYSPQFTRPPLEPKAYHVDPAYPALMAQVWDYFFGEVAVRTGTSMAVTEFAFGRIEGTDLATDPVESGWADVFFWYLRERGLPGPHFFWAWNADSSDTANLMTRDWRGIRADLADRLFSSGN